MQLLISGVHHLVGLAEVPHDTVLVGPPGNGGLMRNVINGPLPVLELLFWLARGEFLFR